MTFEPLFTTARVVTAIYRIASTSLLMIYLVSRVRQGRKYKRNGSRERAIRHLEDQ
jgi:hypothetical protein